MDRKTISRIKERLTIGGASGLAVLSAVTLVLVVAGMQDPGPFALGDVALYYSNLFGAMVGWTWMSVAMSVQMLSDRDNDPVLAAAIFIVGLSLIFIFNTIIVSTFQTALILQVIGYIMLIIDAMGMGFYLYYVDPEQRTNIARA